MVVNVVRTETLLLVEECFVLGKWEVCKLQHSFWPPIRLLDADGRTGYGLRWTTMSPDIECWILDLQTKQTLAKFRGGHEGELSYFQPVELNHGEPALNVFDKPVSLHPIGPDCWAIHLSSMPNPVSIRLFDDERLKGQVAARVPITICDLALSWLWATTLARGIPEVYWPPIRG